MLQRSERPVDERAAAREIAVHRFFSRQRLRGKPRQQRDHHGTARIVTPAATSKAAVLRPMPDRTRRRTTG